MPEETNCRKDEGRKTGFIYTELQVRLQMVLRGYNGDAGKDRGEFDGSDNSFSL